MRVIACGGRTYAVQSVGKYKSTVSRERQVIFDSLDKVHAERAITLLIHGDANGADTVSGEWATSRGVTVLAVPAQWERFGKRAGAMRNGWMLDKKPDLVVAFPGGSGTQHMVTIATRNGVEVIHFGWNNELLRGGA